MKKIGNRVMMSRTVLACYLHTEPLSTLKVQSVLNGLNEPQSDYLLILNVNFLLQIFQSHFTKMDISHLNLSPLLACSGTAAVAHSTHTRQTHCFVALL